MMSYCFKVTILAVYAKNVLFLKIAKIAQRFGDSCLRRQGASLADPKWSSAADP